MLADVVFLDRPTLATELRGLKRLVAELLRRAEAGHGASPRHLQLLHESIDGLDAAAPDLAGPLAADLSAAGSWLAEAGHSSGASERHAARERARGFLAKAAAETNRLMRFIEA